MHPIDNDTGSIDFLRHNMQIHVWRLRLDWIRGKLFIHAPNAKIIQDGGQHGGQPRFVEYFTRILDLFYAGLP
jgi:hypothetical protein